jgi:BlaI family penicillinase repressor
MNTKAAPQPTESELEILNVLWKYGASTVRFVNDKLNEQRPVGYTTTLKIMQIMFDKNLVKRDETGKSHIYSAASEANAIQNRLIDRMLNTAFEGSASKLIMRTLGSHRPNPEELEEIRRLLDDIEKNEGS